MMAVDFTSGQLEIVEAQPLVVPITPRRGEGMADAVLRATAENSYSTTHAVLLAAGMEGRYAAGIASRAIGHEERLAVTLGFPHGADDVRRLLYYPDPERKGWHDFFGTRIRLAHREVLRRRVSPRALRESLHSKAIWSIKVFSFDPATKEMLLEKCPECGKYFGFIETVGIAFCSSCLTRDHEGFSRGRVDLRDFPQPLVQIDDIEALDFVTGLIDPDPVVREAFNPNLPDCITSFDRGTLFEFAVALACALTADPSRTTSFLPRPASRADYSRFSPEVLAAAGRAIIEWPSGFHRLADIIRSNANRRPGHFGIKKELGPLLALRLDPHIDPQLRELARHALEGDMAQTSTGLTMVRRKENLFRDDLLTVERAARKFRASRKSLAKIASDPRVDVRRAGTADKAPILLVETELAAILATRKDLVSAASTGRRLGVPCVALRSLAQANLLEIAENPIGLPPGDYFERRSLDRLIDEIQALLAADGRPSGAINLVEAAGSAGSPFRNSWQSLLIGVLEGRIRAWAGEKGAFSKRILLESLDEARRVAQPATWDDCGDPSVTRADAALLLAATAPNIFGLIQSKLLPRQLRLSDIQSFANKYLLTQQVMREFGAKRFSHSRFLVRFLLDEGLRPVLPRFAKNQRYLWVRAEVMKLKGLTLPFASKAS